MKQKTTEVKCPHYKGEGYGYEFDDLVFNFCDECNEKLLAQMVEQDKLEEQLK